ncbi:MAG: hypothetical protein VKJ09_11330 [Leptolyngbya sp.]|nr:hypothetical protein [Leptolyngbya sp.]
MRPPVEIWQGCLGYWQSAFIRENLLPLGHAAWQGYRAQGRGLVVCDVEVIEAKSVHWRGDVVKYQTRYIPAAVMSDYLKAQGLKSGDRHHLMDAVQTYRPEGELLIAIAPAGSVEINWLRNLAIAPPDCYQQVCNRWDEFALESSADGRGYGD